MTVQQYRLCFRFSKKRERERERESITLKRTRLNQYRIDCISGLLISHKNKQVHSMISEIFVLTLTR